jgi:indolepyruvate ferredoxin oxidoreductase, beta subunit
MNKEMNILMCGLGGQGIVMATRMLAEAAFIEGYRVLTTDVPPGAQRFAPTYSYIRIGEDIFSEVFPEGEADLVLGFELRQSLKLGMLFVREDGIVIFNERAIQTAAVPSVGYSCIDDILSDFDKMGIKHVRHFDASSIATEVTGILQTMNMVMLGAAFATKVIPIQRSTINAVIQKWAPKDSAKLNLRAFAAGFNKFIAQGRDYNVSIKENKS